MITIEPRFLWHGEPNKTEMIREAFRELGTNAPNSQVLAYVQERWGVEVGTGRLAGLRRTVAEEARPRAQTAPALGEGLQVRVGQANGTVPGPSPVHDPVPSLVDAVRLVRRAITTAGGKEALKALVDEL